MAESRWVRVVSGSSTGNRESALSQIDDYAVLPAAAAHANRLARNTTDGRLYFSNGVSWRLVDGLDTLNGVGISDQSVDLISNDGSIQITPNAATGQINVQANAGAIAVAGVSSIEGLTGAVDVEPLNAITVATLPGTTLGNKLQIGESHSARTDDPHNLTYLQLGPKTPNNSTQRGPWNPIVTAIRGSGRRLYEDEDFTTGLNSVQIYNNAENGAVTHTRGIHSTFESGNVAPNSSGYSIKISYLNPPGAANPGYGGFVQRINSKHNHTFVQVFQAKLPAGRQLALSENSQGSNNTSHWLTPVAGTGKWEWYARVSHCGDAGAFSDGGHVYVLSSGPNTSFDWYLASCTTIDVTEGVLGGQLHHNTPDVYTNGANFNEITAQGIYLVYGNGTWTGSSNAPTAAYPYGLLEVIRSNPTKDLIVGFAITQRYVAHAFPKTEMWVRQNFNGTWRQWLGLV